MGKYFDSGFRIPDFTKGQRVRYVSDSPNPRREYGVVSSTNDKYVFVKFDNSVMKMVTGDEPYTSQSCLPGNLVFEEDQP